MGKLNYCFLFLHLIIQFSNEIFKLTFSKYLFEKHHFTPAIEVTFICNLSKRKQYFEKHCCLQIRCYLQNSLLKKAIEMQYGYYYWAEFKCWFFNVVFLSNSMQTIESKFIILITLKQVKSYFNFVLYHFIATLLIRY